MSEDDRPEDPTEVLQEYLERRHDFLAWLDVRVETIDDGTAALTVPYDRKLLNEPPEGVDGVERPPGSMHGGVAATLVDTAGGMACRSALADPLVESVATINLNVNYLRRATADITARAEVARAGGTVGWANVLVESETPAGETEAVAIGQGAYRLFRE